MLQNRQPRVQLLPAIMNVAVRRDQQRPMFGQAASSQTVARPLLRISALVSTYPPESGFLAITQRGRRPARTSCPSSATETSTRSRRSIGPLPMNRSSGDEIGDAPRGVRVARGGFQRGVEQAVDAEPTIKVHVREGSGWRRSGGYAQAHMVLSDRTIREYLASGRLVIDPYDPSLVQPSSVDIRVSSQFRVFHNNRQPYIDVRRPLEDLTDVVVMSGDEPFILHPGEFVLGSTLERVAIPDDLVARLEGKSSLGRLGLLIHSTAGYIDPGWDGQITLELSNVARLPITIYPGMPIGQISFLTLTTPVDQPYRGKYQGQSGPTASEYHKNFSAQE